VSRLLVQGRVGDAKTRLADGTRYVGRISRLERLRFICNKPSPNLRQPVQTAPGILVPFTWKIRVIPGEKAPLEPSERALGSSSGFRVQVPGGAPYQTPGQNDNLTRF
jgi:hypothetical protein